MKPSDKERTGEGMMAEINVTPFTDVLLVLLIIFMVLAALATPPGFQKSFEPPSSGPIDPHPKRPIEVRIQDQGPVLVDGVPAADLDTMMRAAVQRHRSDPVHETQHIELFAGDTVPYQRIVDVLDAGRLAGDDDIALVVEKEGR